MKSLTFLLIALGLQNPVVAQGMGTISGKLIYPSSYMPSQVVCAIETHSLKRFCIRTNEGDRVFSMKIPTGNYYLSSEVGKLTAWFTTYNVRCGANCSSQKVQAQVVSIRHAGDSARDICVCDWYTPDEQISF